MPGYYASPGSSAGGPARSWPLGHTSLHVCHHITYDLLPTHQVMELGQPNNGPRYHFCAHDMSLLLARSSPICSVAAHVCILISETQHMNLQPYIGTH